MTDMVPREAMAVKATPAATPIVANQSEFFFNASPSVSTCFVDFPRLFTHDVTLSKFFLASAEPLTSVSRMSCVSAIFWF